MAYGIKLRVWGDYACFTRPEMKVERVSYDVMTPSAARGILEAIYWKPEIAWTVDVIHVLRPIRFTSVRRNEVGCRISADSAKGAMNAGKGNLGIYIEEERQQRAAMILRDVEYIIEAHFDVLSGQDAPAKHFEMFCRRAERGQYFHRPYLGCREFPADFALAGNECAASEIAGVHELGMMLLDLDFKNGMRPVFFEAILKEGVLRVPRMPEGGEA